MMTEELTEREIEEIKTLVRERMDEMQFVLTEQEDGSIFIEAIGVADHITIAEADPGREEE